MAYNDATYISRNHRNQPGEFRRLHRGVHEHAGPGVPGGFHPPVTGATAAFHSGPGGTAREAGRGFAAQGRPGGYNAAAAGGHPGAAAVAIPEPTRRLGVPAGITEPRVLDSLQATRRPGVPAAITKPRVMDIQMPSLAGIREAHLADIPEGLRRAAGVTPRRTSEAARCRRFPSGAARTQGGDYRPAASSRAAFPPEDLVPVHLGYIQRPDAFEHQRQASDLVRIIAAGQQVVRAREANGQFQRVWIEVDRVEIEFLSRYVWGRALVPAAFGERANSSSRRSAQSGIAPPRWPAPSGCSDRVQPRRRRPGRGRKGRVHRKTVQRHEPIFVMASTPKRMRRTNVEHRARLVRVLDSTARSTCRPERRRSRC